jgi:hypothetical protein
MLAETKEGDNTMFTSTLKQAATKALLGAALLGGSTTFLAPPAGAQTPAVRQFVLSRPAQQGLYRILRNATPYERRLVWDALLKIGPERAEEQLAQLNGMSAYELQIRSEVYSSILQVLPPRYHQRFVNGLFEASPEEEQFAAQLINAKAQAMNAPGTAGPSNTDYLTAQRLNRIWTWLQH